MGLEVASLYGVLDLKDNLTPGLGSAQNAIQSFGGRITSAGKSITAFGAQTALIAAPLTLIGRQSLSTASAFDSAMAEISARTGIAGDDLEMVRRFAIQMGMDTAYSAQESADAFLQLLSSGQSVTDAIATLPIVLDLAAASGEQLGYTADALTDILAAFNLGIEDATSTADALARAAGASSASVGSLADGLANVGPVASTFGIDLETTVTTLAVLSENGIKGAEAGTALKSMLLTMTSPTENVAKAWSELGTSFYDAEGNARPLPNILEDIKKGLDGKPAEDQNRIMKDLAGSYGIVALTALLGDLSITDMKDSMSKQADAATVADARMDTFGGTVDQLSGSIETLQIEAFTPFMNKTLRPVIELLTTGINKVTKWATANPELSNSILAVAAGFVTLSASALIAGPLVTFLGGGLSVVGAAAGLLYSPLGLLALVALAAATNFGGFGDKLEDVRRDIEQGDIDGLIHDIGEGLLSIPNGIASWIGAQIGINVPAGLAAWDGIMINIGAIFSALPKRIEAAIESLNKIEVPNSLREIADLVINTANALGRWTGIISVPDNPDSAIWQARYNALIQAGYAPEEARIEAGPPRAVGGPVTSGMPYIVGERGPELYVPNQNGFIVPNGQFGGGNITVQLVLDGSVIYESNVSEARRRNTGGLLV